MINGIYYFNNRDVTMNVFIQINKVVNFIQENEKISFLQALEKFYISSTYNKLTQVENGLWAESYNYIFDLFCEEV